MTTLNLEFPLVDVPPSRGPLLKQSGPRLTRGLMHRACQFRQVRPSQVGLGRYVMLCQICGEDHAPQRGLSFDGFGVNACNQWRSRLATFDISTEQRQRAAKLLGPLFEAAPDLLEACKYALANLRSRGDVRKDFSGHNAIATLGKAIAKAEGRQNG
jgi:hypothetical protein